MTTQTAPQKYLALRSSGISALMLLAACCGSALASSDIPAPPPELVAHTDTSLHGILDEEAAPPALKTLDSSKTRGESKEDAEEVTLGDMEIADIATRLPGVSATDLPRFRRQMFRTDI